MICVGAAVRCDVSGVLWQSVLRKCLDEEALGGPDGALGRRHDLPKRKVDELALEHVREECRVVLCKELLAEERIYTMEKNRCRCEVS